MITLVSALLGFLGSMIPEIFSFIRENRDRRHELQLLELQIKQQQQGVSERLEAVYNEQLAQQFQALYQTYQTNIGWVDALNGTVRPVMAYAFFLIYAVMKLLQFSMIEEQGGNILPWHLWGEEDQAIFSAIISFYFGQRAFSKQRK